jgi:acid stress-induced BolA-like protein IbaG/YrbA
MAEPTPSEVRGFIAAGLLCEELQVEGDGRHFFATIVSSAFEGLPRVRRHQRVYEVLGDRMREQIHALSMKTLTPAEARAASLADPPPRPPHHPSHS